MRLNANIQSILMIVFHRSAPSDAIDYVMNRKNGPITGKARCFVCLLQFSAFSAKAAASKELRNVGKI